MPFANSERFSLMDSKDRDRLEILSKLDEFKAGDTILAGGQPSEWLYLIASGSVDVKARDATLFTLGPGDLFGELESFCELPESVKHIARTDTIVRAVPKGPLKHELKTHRSLATGLLAVYCRSISEKVRKANEVAVKLGPAPARGSQPPRQSHLDEEDVSWLAVLGQRVEVGNGEIVVAEGDTTRSFYVIEKGAMEVRKKTPSGDRTLAHLGDRDMFGFMAFVDGKPRSASVIATTPAYVAKIEPDVLEKATHLNFTVSFKFLGTLCSVLGRTYRDTVSAILAH